MKRKKLVIISHTEHVIQDKKAYGWGPTINEINELAQHWQEVIHVACLHRKPLPLSSVTYSAPNIQFMGIPPFGGKSIKAKLGILFKAPITIITVLRAIKGASDVQLRLPTGIGLYLLPLFSFFIPRKFTLWIKYAGDWSAANAPASFSIQRWWLVKNWARCKVTINGFWPNQPKHCISFENPCLVESDITQGIVCIASKRYRPPFNLIFVGRVEHAKGIQRIVDALSQTPNTLVNRLDIIGDGKDFEYYSNQLHQLPIPINLHGFLTKKQIVPLLQQAHFLLLPSDSEGFPKVVAEGACYGCIPVVSDVASISHYITPDKGFVWPLDGNITYTDVLNTALKTPEPQLKDMSQKLSQLSGSFTHLHYLNKLQINIFQH